MYIVCEAQGNTKQWLGTWLVRCNVAQVFVNTSLAKCGYILHITNNSGDISNTQSKFYIHTPKRGADHIVTSLQVPFNNKVTAPIYWPGYIVVV